MKPYIQPFERVLALREIDTLASAPAEGAGDASGLVFAVTTAESVDALARRLTYWEWVAEAKEGHRVLTQQVRQEAAAVVASNGVAAAELKTVLPVGDNAKLPGRRMLRYGSHGIHEYRGKFFPQLVRSLLNVAGVGSGKVVLDPMCGSGTTPVEARLLGCKAVGVDMNPLSVFISRAKCDVLHLAPDVLLREVERLSDRLEGGSAGSRVWLKGLPEADQAYLGVWFGAEVLDALERVAVGVEATAEPVCRSLFWVCLSNILREVSWQKTDDLRVRKQVDSGREIDVEAEFKRGLNGSLKTILAQLYQLEDGHLPAVTIWEGDARSLNEDRRTLVGRVDCIVTSPPYATALPYLDTDRLSLAYLRLLPRPEHRQRDYLMIGNREITDRHRYQYWLGYEEERHRLPGSVTKTIDRIEAEYANAEVGFRRRNLAALLVRYFLDMRRVLETFRVLLRPGAPAYVVVGNNHTKTPGGTVVIETDSFLGELGEAVGLCLEEAIPMEMLVSRDIFRQNTGSSETVLCFKN